MKTPIILALTALLGCGSTGVSPSGSSAGGGCGGASTSTGGNGGAPDAGISCGSAPTCPEDAGAENLPTNQCCAFSGSTCVGTAQWCCGTSGYLTEVCFTPGAL
jgi:hypothetical protein